LGDGIAVYLEGKSVSLLDVLTLQGEERVAVTDGGGVELCNIDSFAVSCYCILVSRWFYTKEVSVTLWGFNCDEHGVNSSMLLGDKSIDLKLQVPEKLAIQQFIRDIASRIRRESISTEKSRLEEHHTSGNEIGFVESVLSLVISDLDYDQRILLIDQVRALAVYFTVKGEKIHVQSVFGREVYSDLDMRSIRDSLAVLIGDAISSVIDSDSKDISRLEAVVRSDKLVQLEHFRQNRASTYKTGCLHEAFSCRAEKSKTNIAVVSEKQKITYSELENKSNQLSRHLSDLNISRGAVVAIYLDRSIDLIVSILGVLKSGAAYLPLDSSLPKNRLNYMLDDCDVTAVVVKHAMEGVEELTCGKVVCLDDDATQKIIQQKAYTKRSLQIDSNDLAYVIYTSGSTGKPKGILMPHRPVMNLINVQPEQTAKLSDPLKTLQFASIGFDAACQEIMTTLISGGTLVMIDDELRSDIDLLAKFISKNKIQRIFVPFPVLQALAVVFSQADDELVSSIELIVTAGEQLFVTDEIRSWSEKSRFVLINQYGPSETHATSYYTLSGDPRSWSRRPPIGRPIKNTQLHIFDDDMNFLPSGAVGELYISGIGLSDGYQNNSKITKERFITKAVDGSKEYRLYKTGDLARWSSSGDVEFLGRVDHQVKIRGYRIELGEIESQLLQEECVEEAVVLAVDTQQGDKNLVAYVTDRTLRVSDFQDQLKIKKARSAQLRFLLKEYLPVYMVPRTFIFMDSMPLNSNKKIDRKNLPSPSSADFGAVNIVEPQQETEKEICEVWKELLGVDCIGIEDHFSDLGGHSLMVMKLFRWFNDRYGIPLSVKEFMPNPTIKFMASKVL
jgi:amino acid adenylation domain-containing protein